MMPKRKGHCDNNPSAPTCLTLVEFMFMVQLVSEALGEHRPCVLKGKTCVHWAMIATRYGPPKLHTKEPHQYFRQDEAL